MVLRLVTSFCQANLCTAEGGPLFVDGFAVCMILRHQLACHFISLSAFSLVLIQGKMMLFNTELAS